MAISTNEWTFTVDVSSQINVLLQNRPDLPFSSSKVEERGKGSNKRRDLTLYDRSNQVVITGEVKMRECGHFIHEERPDKIVRQVLEMTTKSNGR